MSKVKAVDSSSPKRRTRPALTPEAREKQLISLAVDLAEQQLRDGTASSQVISHFLKLGSTREELEKERLMEENRLLKAKTEAIQEDKERSIQYEVVINELRRYNGQGDSNEED